MNCKPGDLAYIAYEPENRRNPNLGRVVEVISVHLDHPKYGVLWNVKSQQPLHIWDGNNGQYLGEKTYCACADAWLKPISGVPVHDEEHNEVTA